jgi:AraC family transcriptional regulator
MELVAIAARFAGAAEFRAPAWLSRAHELIHDRFRESLTVADLAEAAGVHPVHFSRVFRKQYDVTPSALVRDLRIRWAAGRIRSTREPLSAIAIEAGFYDQAHFARAFRKRVGVPPSHFR